MLRVRTASLVLAAAGACGGGEDAQGEEEGSVPFASATAGDTGDESGDTGSAPAPGEATELCGDAPPIGEGLHVGTLRGRQPDLAGACGQGGPDVFFRLDVPRRSDVWLQARGVGFVPRAGVLPHGCAAEWTDRTLACVEGIGGWITDVGASSSLVVSIGIDPEDPALLSAAPAAPTEGPDPLDFVLDVRLRDVLSVGEPCEPASRGRCGTGTACLAPDDDDSSVAVCTVLPADTCATAEPLALPFGETTIEISPTEPHTDAHAHACTGARRPERVIALSVPNAEEPPRLTVSTTHADVGLALRRNDCDPAGELACDAPSAEGARIVADLAFDSAVPDASRRVFLFVELPVGELPIGELPGGESGATGEGEAGRTGEEAPIRLSVDLAGPG